MRLYSLFANGVKGCLWWCHSDFCCPDDLPCRDVQIENDGLGLTRTGGEAKPAVLEMQKFRAVVDGFGGHMPEMERKAAIIVSDLRNNWPALFNCYALCVQAGIAPKFVRPDRDCLEPYALILASAMSGFSPVSVPAWKKVTRTVQNGSTLYVSGNGLSLVNMKELFGIAEMEKLPLEGKSLKLKFNAGFECELSAQYRNRFHIYDAEPGAFYTDGSPAMLKRSYGRGTACFLAMPLELSLAETTFALEKYNTWKLYAELRKTAGLSQTVDCPDPQWERYWNADSSRHGFLTIINHRREAVEAELAPRRRSLAAKTAAGQAELTGTRVRIEPLQAAILEIALETD